MKTYGENFKPTYMGCKKTLQVTRSLKKKARRINKEIVRQQILDMEESHREDLVEQKRLEVERDDWWNKLYDQICEEGMGFDETLEIF